MYSHVDIVQTYTQICLAILMVSFMTLFDIYWNPLLAYLALETHVFSETNFVFIFSDILSYSLDK